MNAIAEAAQIDMKALTLTINQMALNFQVTLSVPEVTYPYSREPTLDSDPHVRIRV